MVAAWHDEQAAEAAERWASRYGKDLALLVHASRLLGSDPALASHGGGNTSIKIHCDDLFGSPTEVLLIKASGHDLATITPDGFVPLDLQRLRRLVGETATTTPDLDRALRAARIDPDAGFPSVETLLHAVVPARVVLHAHAEAVLVLADQADGAALVETALGESFAVIEYAMPGPALAHQVARTLEARPAIQGLAVRHHGLFVWGASAEEAYRRLAEAVLACRRVADEGLRDEPLPRIEPEAPTPAGAEQAAVEFARRLRGRLSLPDRERGLPNRPVVEHRASAALLDLLRRPTCAELCRRGLLTPDHVLHTGVLPLVLEGPHDDLSPALDAFRRDYDAYVERHGGRIDQPGYDPRPRVILVPEVGVFGCGGSRREARAAASLAERTVFARFEAESLGRFDPTPEAEVHALEFWPLEQAKRAGRRPLEGRVALITGAAGAIGAGIAASLARQGAVVFLADRPGTEDQRRLARAVERVQREAGDEQALALPFDVTDPAAVEAAIDRTAPLCGGIDLLVLSHGMAEVAPIDDLDPARLETVFRVNALGAFHVLGTFVRQVRAQGRGGDVVLVSTKNVPDPGASFSAYSASKAAAHQLARVAAIELAGDDIRVNLVSPDAVFGDAEIPSKLWQEVGPGRARSKGLDPAELPEHYRRRNLLGTPVRVEDVARAVLFFALRQTPTTGAVLPVDGGLPGAFPR